MGDALDAVRGDALEGAPFDPNPILTLAEKPTLEGGAPFDPNPNPTLAPTPTSANPNPSPNPSPNQARPST